MKTHRTSCLLAVALTLAVPSVRGQGSLDPPSGTPTPTMRTLNELYDAIGGVTPLSPSSFVELSSTSAIAAGGSSSLSKITNSGTNAGTYTVPDGMVLVITDLEVYPESHDSSSILTFQLQQNGVTRRNVRLRGDQPHATSLRTGMVIAAGATLTAVNASPGGSASFRVFVHGYLVEAS